MSVNPFELSQSAENVPPLSSNVLEQLGITEAELGPLAGRVVKLDELIPGIELEGVASLDNFPDSLGEARERYDNRVMEGSDISITFASKIYKYLCALAQEDTQAFEALRSKFKDSVLVDIGAGTGRGPIPFPIGYMIANMLEAKAYVGVEPFNWKKLFEFHLKLVNDERLKKFLGDKSPIPFNLVAEDALTFLQRLPESSVSLLSAGIADEVIGDETYYDELGSETLRVLQEGGLCLVSNSVTPKGLYNKDHIYLDGELVVILKK